MSQRVSASSAAAADVIIAAATNATEKSSMDPLLDSSWLDLLSALRYMLGVVTLVCLARFAQRIWKFGLLHRAPALAQFLTERSIFNIIEMAAEELKSLGDNLLSIAMLASMRLPEAERQRIIDGMNPRIRHYVFDMRLADHMPRALLRVLVGQRRSSVQHVPDHRGPMTEARRRVRDRFQKVVTRIMMLRCMQRPESIEALQLSAGRSMALAKWLWRSHVEFAISLAPGMSRSQRMVFRKLLFKSTMRTMASAARSLVPAARDTAGAAIESGCDCAASIKETLVGAVRSERTWIAAASASAGAVTVGASGGTVGLVSGGAVGAAIGIVPAVFTLGLSIPFGAAIGSAVGLCAGTGVGGTFGALGGGWLGATVYDSHNGGAGGTGPAAVQDGR